MKKFFQVHFALMAILLGGCATQQLSVDKHGKKLAPRLGTKESEIQFLGYGDFIARFDHLDRRIVAKGIIALTESDLRLETRNYRYLFSKELTSIPFHEMEGVSKIASQIHIKHRGEAIVLELNSRSFRYLPPKEPETVFQLLASRGIPVYEVAEVTEFPRYTILLGADTQTISVYYDPFYDGGVEDINRPDLAHEYGNHPAP